MDTSLLIEADRKIQQELLERALGKFLEQWDGGLTPVQRKMAVMYLTASQSSLKDVFYGWQSIYFGGSILDRIHCATSLMKFVGEERIQVSGFKDQWEFICDLSDSKMTTEEVELVFLTAEKKFSNFPGGKKDPVCEAVKEWLQVNGVI